MPYELHGADDLARLSRALKAAGEKGLQKQLSKALTDAMKPLRAELPRSARATLPKRGGLAEGIAKSKTRIVRRNTGRAVGVRLRVENKDAIQRIDKGDVRHPTFKRPGRRPGWVSQRVTPGWFTHPTDAAAPAFAEAADAGMAAVVDEINRR